MDHLCSGALRDRLPGSMLRKPILRARPTVADLTIVSYDPMHIEMTGKSSQDASTTSVVPKGVYAVGRMAFPDIDPHLFLAMPFDYTR